MLGLMLKVLGWELPMKTDIIDNQPFCFTITTALGDVSLFSVRTAVFVSYLYRSSSTIGSP